MLLSYTLLYAMLTTFAAAVPIFPEQVPTLPLDGIPLQDAAKYLTYKYEEDFEPG